MKKVYGVLCGLIIGCNSVLGSVSLGSNALYKEVNNESIVVEVNEAKIDQIGSLKEQILSYFEDENQKEVYGSYIVDDMLITQGTIAKILCHYINRMPIYLPEKELCQNPFIGRLIIEYIWGEMSYDETRVITLNDWDILFSQAKQFKQDQDYIKKASEASPLNIKEKINQYRENSIKSWRYEKVLLGNAVSSNKYVRLNDQEYKLYYFLGTSYLSLKTLEKMGFSREKSNDYLHLVWQGYSLSADDHPAIKSMEVYMNNEVLYIGALKTYSLTTEEDILIPIRALETYFDLNISDSKIILVPKGQVMSESISCNNEMIINKTNRSLKIIYTDLYWDGVHIIENQSGLIEMSANGKLVKNTQLYALRNARYLTTVVHYVETDYNVLSAGHTFGQDISSLLKRYQQTLNNQNDVVIKENQTLFPPSIIIGTMKYAVNGFAKGQKVEVWAAEDGVHYKIKNAQDKTVKVPWNSVSIPKDPATAKDKPTKDQIEAFINSKDMSSQTAYLVWTDLYRQQTYVFKGKKNEWQLIKILLCSTGKNITPTPRGTFELTNRIPYFGVNKGYRCKNAFQIFGDYLFHSIIFDVTGTRLLEGKGVLGRRASQGCIRFSEEDSLWFYNTMKANTRVWIN
ncbi:L,D-transpeptidase [Cellulosilyticum sp. I15G10I2]|uniref:L,D-transpeptidase n=1 Tax=Cellulosilyticum sp. I15G10I2 TaxID=1892843 RepID=UPI00085C3BEC|nr:L,D-transpeptidase [Cellulosilyticum sp. I15G10I2]